MNEKDKEFLVSSITSLEGKLLGVENTSRDLLEEIRLLKLLTAKSKDELVSINRRIRDYSIVALCFLAAFTWKFL